MRPEARDWAASVWNLTVSVKVAMCDSRTGMLALKLLRAHLHELVSYSTTSHLAANNSLIPVLDVLALHSCARHVSRKITVCACLNESLAINNRFVLARV